MVDFDTPQLKLVKNLFDAYASLDVNNVEPLLSKNYQYESLPESTELSKLSKEDHLQVWKPVFSSVNKLEVRIRHRRTAPKLSD
jgi:ketosteroid isomerase-like protein